MVECGSVVVFGRSLVCVCVCVCVCVYPYWEEKGGKPFMQGKSEWNGLKNLKLHYLGVELLVVEVNDKLPPSVTFEFTSHSRYG